VLDSIKLGITVEEGHFKQKERQTDAHLMASFFQDNMGKLAPERLKQCGF